MVAQMIKKIRLPMQDTRVQFLGWEDPWEKEMARVVPLLHHSLSLPFFHFAFHSHSSVPPPQKAVIETSYLLWKRTPRNHTINTYYRGASEKAMAPHSSTLAWRIPWTEEPGGLQSMGSLRVGHD